MRTHGSGLSSRHWRMPSHGFGVAGRLRVVSEEARIGVAPLFQRAEHAIVQHRPLGWGDGVEHRLARELVPKSKGAAFDPEEARVDACVRLSSILTHDLPQEAGVDTGPDDRRCLEDTPCGRGKAPCTLKDNVAYGIGDAVRLSRSEELGDQERVAARLPMHHARIEALVSNQHPYCFEGKGPKGNPANGSARRQHGQQATQGMVERKLVVSVGKDGE
jgi:hypothetical protein